MMSAHLGQFHLSFRAWDSRLSLRAHKVPGLSGKLPEQRDPCGETNHALELGSILFRL